MVHDAGAVPGGRAAEAALVERLRALGEYAALWNRRLLGERRPGDRQRLAALAALLERTGGVPPELRWRP